MDAAPLAWWEEIQISIVESLLRDGARGVSMEDIKRFREHPEEWRAFREQIRECLDKQGGGNALLRR